MRPSQHQQMLMHAYIASMRGTCRRRKTGAVITDISGHILSVGYNGVASGIRHCLDVPCKGATAKSGKSLYDCQAIHAEVNAIVQCPSLDRAHRIYCTVSPCDKCLDLLIQTSIIEIYFAEQYAHNERQRWMSSKSPYTPQWLRQWKHIPIDHLVSGLV